MTDCILLESGGYLLEEDGTSRIILQRGKIGQFGNVTPCSYTVYQTDGIIYAQNGSTGLIDFQHTDFVTIMNSILSLSDVGSIFLKTGTYILNSDLVINKQCSIIGENVSIDYTIPEICTRIYGINYGTIITSKYVIIENILFDGRDTTNHKTVLQIIQVPTSVFMTNVTILGVYNDDSQIVLELLGTIDNYVGNCNFTNLAVVQGNIGLHLKYSSQNSFIGQCVIVAWSSIGILIEQSDNNYFQQPEVLPNSIGLSSIDVQNGTSGGDSRTLANYFENLTIRSGDTNFVDNGDPTYNQPTIVSYMKSDSGVICNILKSGSLIIKSQENRGGVNFNFSTPTLPIGIGISNSIQNKSPYSIFIYQQGGTGIHIIDNSNNDVALVSLSLNLIKLNPGEKIYFATTKPLSWQWYADA